MTGALRKLAERGMMGLVVLAPLLIGGTRPEAILALSGAALALLAIGAAGNLRRGAQIPAWLWGPVVVAAFVALQLVPLPLGWLEALSPLAAETWQGVPTPEAATLSAAPLSLNPNATQLALVHQLGFCATLLLAGSAGRLGRLRLSWAIAGSAALVAGIGLAQWALEADRIFGVYQSLHRARLSGFFSTFINNNTLAGFLCLGALTSVGLLAHGEPNGAPRLALAAAILAGLGCLLSGSRGGHVALVLGLLVFAALAMADQRRQGTEAAQKAWTTAKVALPFGLIGLVAAWVLTPEWRSDLPQSGQTEDKFVAWQAAWRHVEAFRLTGSGRGTFELVHPRFQEILVSGSVSHPENIALQLGAELGLLGTALALAAGVGAWIFAARNRPLHGDPLHNGLLAGLAAASAQQCVDFGFEAAGLSLPVAVALGLVVATAFHRGNETRRRRGLAAGLLVAAALGALAVGVTARATLHGSADATVRRLAALDPKLPPTELDAALHRAVQRHPTDYALALTAAQRLASAEPPRLESALGWLNRAMALFPAGGKAHRLAARVLVASGRPAQAATEFRRALAAEPWTASTLMREAVSALEDPRHLAQVPPIEDRALQLFGNALLAKGDAARAREALEEILFLHPDAPEARLARARACLALRDAACVERDAQWLVSNGRAAVGHAFRGLAALRAGDQEAARKALSAGAQAGGEHELAFVRAAAEITVGLGDLVEARRALDRWWRLAGTRDREAAAALATRARLESKLGDPQLAVRAWQDALARDARPSWALAAVEAAQRTGDQALANDLLRDARARWPKDARFADARSTEPQ